MNVIAFNGSPRKEWNTATLLKSALEGAASCGAQTELVHLYDLDYKGCTGAMRSLIERLVFPFYTYTDPPASLFPGKTRVGILYAFGATEEMAIQLGWDQSFNETGAMMGRVLGPAETLQVYDTLQFDDYSKYVAPRFDPVQKAARRRDIFPQDCRRAFEMGARLVQHFKK
jgi:hypothetical protein